MCYRNTRKQKQHVVYDFFFLTVSVCFKLGEFDVCCVKFGFYFMSSKRASSHYSKGTEVSGSKSSKTQVHPKLVFYTKALFSSMARAGEKICC